MAALWDQWRVCDEKGNEDAEEAEKSQAKTGQIVAIPDAHILGYALEGVLRDNGRAAKVVRLERQQGRQAGLIESVAGLNAQKHAFFVGSAASCASVWRLVSNGGCCLEL